MIKRALILVFIAAVLITIPASAKDKTVGERISISILEGVESFTFDADTPFHIAHGWTGLSAKGGNFKNFGFELYLHGVHQEVDHVSRTPSRAGKGVEFTLHWIFNFPDGMPAGDYIFTGVWKTTCQIAVDAGWISGPCADPNAWVEFVNPVVGTFE